MGAKDSQKAAKNSIPLGRKGTNMSGKPPFYGWRLVAVLFALDFLNMGFPFFGGAVINTYMLKHMVWDSLCSICSSVCHPRSWRL